MTTHAHPLLAHLHRLAAPAAPDATLLTRWIDQRDEAAFAALMARHGPMVLGVCRRLLGDGQDAEDVFQATFLVLSRQASRLRQPEALAGFLHTIARRLARKARAATRRRQRTQTDADAPEPVDPQPHVLDVLSGRELLALIDEEIGCLPEVYRLPLLLCLLQGRTVEEAARQLGWSIGSLRGRLERGREQLRQRLTRRGIGLSVGVLTLLAPVAVPERLLAESVRHLSGVVPAAISVLAAGSALAIKKVACIVFMAVAATGISLLAVATPRPSPPATPATPPAQAKDEPRHDRYGDPLPEGAVARLGSLRFRVPDQIVSMAFAPDGKTLAVSAHGGLFLIDAANGKRIKHLPTPGRNWTPESHLAFSPDGKRLLSMGPMVGNNGKGVVRLWEWSGDRPPHEYEVGKEFVTWLGWSAKGEPLAIRDEREAVYLHELASGKSRRFACKEPAKSESGNYRDSRFAYTPAGQALALVDDKSIIHVWDSATGRERCSLHAKDVYKLALSPDGRQLATLEGETLLIWDATTGKLLKTVNTDQKYVKTVVFAPDGKTVATAGVSGVRFWDAATGKERSRTQGEWTATQCLAFSGDGKTLATANYSGAFHLWDVKSGKGKAEPEGHRAAPYGARFSPDGRRVVSCLSLDCTLHVWDAASGESLFRISHRNQWVRDAAFSLDGRTLFSSWLDDRVWFSDAANGERRRVLKIEDPERMDTEHSVESMRLSDDGKTLIVFSSGSPKKNGAGPRYQDMLITGWDASTHKQLFWRRHSGSDSRMALSADARVLAAPYPPVDAKSLRQAEETGRRVQQTIRLEDVATGEILLTLPMRKDPPSPLAFSADGRLLTTNHWKQTSDETASVVQLWETATVAVALTLPGALDSKVAFSPDGRLLALTAPSGEILVWNLRLGREKRRFKGFDAVVTHLTFSPDSQRLISGLDDSTLLVWDATARATTPAGKLGTETAAKAWADLADRDAPRAFRARGALASAPEEAIPLLKNHLHPAKPADPQRLRRLLAELDSEQFAVRDKAQEELETFGDLAEPSLRKTLENKPTLEVRKRVQGILDHLRGPVTQPELLQALRGVAVLEDIGTSEARRLLQELAKGAPEARLTREAKAALRRLDFRGPSGR